MTSNPLIFLLQIFSISHWQYVTENKREKNRKLGDVAKLLQDIDSLAFSHGTASSFSLPHDVVQCVDLHFRHPSLDTRPGVIQGRCRQCFPAEVSQHIGVEISLYNALTNLIASVTHSTQHLQSAHTTHTYFNFIQVFRSIERRPLYILCMFFKFIFIQSIFLDVCLRYSRHCPTQCRYSPNSIQYTCYDDFLRVALPKYIRAKKTNFAPFFETVLSQFASSIQNTKIDWKYKTIMSTIVCTMLTSNCKWCDNNRYRLTGFLVIKLK